MSVLCSIKMAQGLLTFTIVMSLCAAFSLPRAQGGRVLDKRLSQHEHYIDGEHNPQYDHEAFLGEDAEEFEDLTPEESRTRLGLIVDKIDMNKDGNVEKDELYKWIEIIQKKSFANDAQLQWRIHNPKGKEKISWKEYKNSRYGFLDASDGSPEGELHKKLLEKEKRRWKLADTNGDGSLNESEFLMFIHPEDVPHMKHLMVTETMEDLDTDGDGKVSLDEYIRDLYRGEPGEEEPSWIERERISFKKHRDRDGDGMLSEDEMREWIIPEGYDPIESESVHLILSSDANKDGNLTKEEVLENYDLFVGSQATDYGDILVKHDEF